MTNYKSREKYFCKDSLKSGDAVTGVIILDGFVIELTVEMREPSKVVHSQMGLLCSVSLSLRLSFFVPFFFLFG